MAGAIAEHAELHEDLRDVIVARELSHFISTMAPLQRHAEVFHGSRLIPAN